MEWIVICLVCTLKTFCAQEPQVFLVYRQAGEEHTFGKARMQMALIALWSHCSIVKQDWAECLGYFNDVGLNSIHGLTSAQSQGFWLPSNASRPSLPVMGYFFGMETLFELCVSCVQHKASLCWNIKPNIIFAVLL